MTRPIVLSVLMIAALSARGESRAPEAFYNPMQREDMSILVFQGTAMAIETNAEYKVSFPVTAFVSKVVKGKLAAKDPM